MPQKCAYTASIVAPVSLLSNMFPLFLFVKRAFLYVIFSPLQAQLEEFEDEKFRHLGQKGHPKGQAAHILHMVVGHRLQLLAMVKSLELSCLNQAFLRCSPAYRGFDPKAYIYICVEL